jgi:hypothetical protein
LISLRALLSSVAFGYGVRRAVVIIALNLQSEIFHRFKENISYGWICQRAAIQSNMGSVNIHIFANPSY